MSYSWPWIQEKKTYSQCFYHSKKKKKKDYANEFLYFQALVNGSGQPCPVSGGGKATTIKQVMCQVCQQEGYRANTVRWGVGFVHFMHIYEDLPNNEEQ